VLGNRPFEPKSTFKAYLEELNEEKLEKEQKIAKETAAN
jgi:hypothetical protein